MHDLVVCESGQFLHTQEEEAAEDRWMSSSSSSEKEGEGLFKEEGEHGNT